MKTRGAVGFAVLVVLGSSAASGCRSNDVVLLDLPADAESGGSSGSPGEGSAAPSAGASGATATSGAAGAGGGSAGTGSVWPNAGRNPVGSAGGGAGGIGTGSAGRNGTTAGTPGAGECLDNDDCPSGSVCDKPGCNVESGICVNDTAFCPSKGDPVCGCNNVTYWNDCVRRKNGARKAREDECGMLIPCRTGADCGVEGAVCAHLLTQGQPCDGRDAPGQCWVLPEPDQCESPRMARFGVCPPPPLPQQGDPGSPVLFPCVDLCGAIRSEKPHIPFPRDVACDAQ